MFFPWKINGDVSIMIHQLISPKTPPPAMVPPNIQEADCRTWHDQLI